MMILSGYIAAMLFCATGCTAFSVVAPASKFLTASITPASNALPHISRRDLTLFATSEEQSKKDDEIERLKSMAQKLRVEAMELEAERTRDLADAAERAFRKFDTNQDGEISLKELKDGLERTLKTELPEKRVKKLMEAFDTSGDGALQLEEFVGVEKFRNRLESLAREEKQAAQDAAKAAQAEREMTKFLESRMEKINDREPTGIEKILSVLPYLFPLMDGLQFGRFLILENGDNPVVGIIAVLFTIYKSIPLGGFIAFFALNFLSANPSINRLIRFNMQQAIFLDIFLFFPGLIAALFSVIGASNIPAVFTEVGSNAIFFTLLAAIGYSTTSSFLGKTPDKIPLISRLVSDRMPNFEIMDMRETQQSKKDEKKKKNDNESEDKQD